MRHCVAIDGVGTTVSLTEVYSSNRHISARQVADLLYPFGGRYCDVDRSGL